jgi:hypothetical protein
VFRPISRDVIEVHVTGPDYDDLTVVDLPGIVRSVGDDESEDLITDVENLLRGYLENKRCVVLCVIPANVDVHNNQVINMCGKVDPEQKRTVPVVTKPDTVQEGGEASVIRLLKGEHKRFVHGFFMVKCRSQKDLNEGKTVTQGLEDERKFFANTEPWRREEAALRDRFGTRSVRRYLATVQADMIRESLPSIVAEMRAKLASVEADLRVLGREVPANERGRLLFQLLREFGAALAHVRHGTADSASAVAVPGLRECCTWPSLLQQDFSEYSCRLFRSRPAGQGIRAGVLHEWGRYVCPRNRAYQGPNSGIWYVERDDVEREVNEAEEGTEVEIEWKGEPRAGRIVDIKDDTGRATIAIYGDANEASPVVLRDVPVTADRVIVLNPGNDLRALVCRSWTSHLRVFVSPDVFNAVFRQFIKSTVEPATRALTANVTDNRVPQLFASTLASVSGDLGALLSKFAPLRATFAAINDDVTRVVRDTCTRHVDHLFDRELSPFSQNDYLYETLQKRRTDKLRRTVVSLAMSGLKPEALANAINSAFDANAKISVEDYNTLELNHVLQSYWRVVLKRLIDEVPQMLSRVAGDNVIQLWITTAEQHATKPGFNVVDLFAEPAHCSHRRAVLMTEASRLTAALAVVSSFGVSPIGRLRECNPHYDVTTTQTGTWHAVPRASPICKCDCNRADSVVRQLVSAAQIDNAMNHIPQTGEYGTAADARAPRHRRVRPQDAPEDAPEDPRQPSAEP